MANRVNDRELETIERVLSSATYSAGMSPKYQVYLPYDQLALAWHTARDLRDTRAELERVKAQLAGTAESNERLITANHIRAELQINAQAERASLLQLLKTTTGIVEGTIGMLKLLQVEPAKHVVDQIEINRTHIKSVEQTMSGEKTHKISQ